VLACEDAPSILAVSLFVVGVVGAVISHIMNAPDWPAD
jgi:hypothetical protein